MLCAILLCKTITLLTYNPAEFRASLRPSLYVNHEEGLSTPAQKSKTYSSSPLSVVLLATVLSHWWSTTVWKQMTLLMYGQKINSSLRLGSQCLRHSPPCVSSHSILSHHIIVRRVSAVQQGILRERPHSY